MQQYRIVNRQLAAVAIALAALALPATASAQHSGSHASSTASAPKENIVQVAVAAGSFNTLVEAVKAAGLVETLSGKGPFTVFAPSDAAFAKVPKATLDGLLADRAALQSVLTFHVIPGRVGAADIVRTNGATPRTVNGKPLDIDVRDGKVFVNGAQVVTADVPASNGVIHVIDAVLLPPAAATGN